VTGTRIRGASGPSPVIVMTRRGLEEQGLADMASVSRIIPQNFTGGQNPGVAGGGDQGGYNNINNSTTLNLRGLGSDATLTLINGHRLPYDAVNQGVDISTIPLAALERIEVITDGASALYGSDAVGGVANLILRRDYDGLQTSARVGASTRAAMSSSNIRASAVRAGPAAASWPRSTIARRRRSTPTTGPIRARSTPRRCSDGQQAGQRRARGASRTWRAGSPSSWTRSWPTAARARASPILATAPVTTYGQLKPSRRAFLCGHAIAPL
jgi:iron complex outermembrane receptor protein